MPIEKACVVCGKSFKVPPARALTAKACSHACAVSVRAKSRERKAVVNCKKCGKAIEVPRSHLKRHAYCSLECRHSDPGYMEQRHDNVVGAKNPMWNGGETARSSGYVFKLAPSHPFVSVSPTGYVLKHRLVVEQRLREECPSSKFLVRLGNQLYLRRDIVVHHLDGDKKNNRKRNLLACTRSAHSLIHHGIMPKPGTYWPPDAKIKTGRRAIDPLTCLPDHKEVT